ncbi:MAG: glycine cleavage system aminomethyltransferase GcvT [Pseudomonadota bacterium]
MSEYDLKQTPLHGAHLALKAKMAAFAGYDMPIQYEGVLAEHNWCRDHAALFDVSHMGQITFQGEGIIEFLEKLTPSSYGSLVDGACKYSVLMNEEGGMIDDLIITRVSDDHFKMVVNGACKDKDVAWFEQHLPEGIMMVRHEDRALLALQGPCAETVLNDVLGIDTAHLNYMNYMQAGEIDVFRLGYTGEDGFELSFPEAQATDIWNKLLAHDEVKPVGLAARDSLRLEMGYPLYGHDIDATTSPIEVGSRWIMGKLQNKTFIGSKRVLDEIENGAKRQRIGFELIDRGVAREGAEIFDASGETQVGVITSGTFSPTLQKAIGMAYIDSQYASDLGTEVIVRVRGRDLKAKITGLPFMEAQTKKNFKKAA